MESAQVATTDDRTAGSGGRSFPWLSSLLGLMTLVGASAAGVWMMRNRPQAVRQAPQPRIPLVEVRSLSPTNFPMTVRAMGVVLPSREVTLQAQVSARILARHPMLVAGGKVRAGETLVELEPENFEIAVRRQRAALDTALAHLRLEQGHQDVARQDLETMRALDLAADVDLELALREPHLAIARAAVASAQTALDAAELDWERRLIKAPFDAIVLSAQAEQGGRLAPGIGFARLAATEAFWIQAALPVEHLDWLLLPDATGEGGSAAFMDLPDGRARQGRVIRRLPDLEPDARMARVIVEVRDPLGGDGLDETASAPLLLNDYVRVRLQGRTLLEVYDIPRSALHDGRQIWLLTEDDRLRIETVTPVWGDETRALARATLPRDARLILSNLAAPVAGMRLRARADEGADGESTARPGPAGGAHE